MVDRARGRGSSHGIDGPILETSLGSAGKVLEAATREAGRREPEIRNVASGASAVQSWAEGTQEGFPGCRTPGEAAGGPGIGSELCAHCRGASVADGDAQEAPVEVPWGAAAWRGEGGGGGAHAAEKISAEGGPTAGPFPSEKCLASWVGACPGDDESGGGNYSHGSPKGNRHMRRLLNQAANGAARTKGSIFEIVYRRSVPRLGHNQAIGAISHRPCRLIWLILHQGVRYEERGPAVTKQSKQRRTARMIRQLRSLGYRG